MSRRKPAAFQPFANTQAAPSPTVAGEIPQQPCTVRFGNNPVSHQVAILFEAPVVRVFLGVEDAEDFAQKLLAEAAIARGSKH